MANIADAGVVTPAFMGLAGLVIPLILLYLLKPRPKQILFPSLMFIELMEKKRRLVSFLERFVRDPLLLVQIIVITLLAAGLTGPYLILEMEGNKPANIVIVIDGSASMQATDVSPSRFGEAVKRAKKVVEGLNPRSTVSIVLSSTVPTTILSKKDPVQAGIALDNLRPLDVQTNINDAIRMSTDFRENEVEDKIYLFSDFSQVTGLEASNAFLKSQGFSVNWGRIGGDASNAAIVDYIIEQNRLNNTNYVSVSVYNTRGVSRIPVKAFIGGKEIYAKTNRIMQGEHFYYDFTLPASHKEQKLKVSIQQDDALAVDDDAHLVISPIKEQKILLLSQESADKYLRLLLEAMPHTSLTINEPPVIENIDAYDIIVVGNVEPSLILPGTFRDIEEKVDSGGSLIIMGSDRTSRMTDGVFWRMLPVDGLEYRAMTQNVELVGGHDVGDDLVFDNVIVEKYHAATLKEEASVLAESDGQPILALMDVKMGTTVYMGLNPDETWSNFRYSASYPILWANLFDHFQEKSGSKKRLNYRAGDIISLGENGSVKTPSGNLIRGSSILADEAGIYLTSGESYGVSLANEQESTITPGNSTILGSTGDSLVEKVITKARIEGYLLAVLAALTLLLADAFLYIRRGLI